MATGYLGSNYTEAQINAVPGFMSNINDTNDSFSARGIAIAPYINRLMSNPTAYVNTFLKQDTNNYAVTGDPSSLQQAQADVAYLKSQGVPTETIQADINKGLSNAASTAEGKGGSLFEKILGNPTAVLEIAAAATIPGAAEALAPSIAVGLGVSSATATVIAAGTLSAASQVASGVPVNQALQNVAVGAVVSTGTNEAANAIISNNPNSSVATVLATPVPGAAAGSLSPVVSAISGALTSGVNASLAGQNVANAVAKGAAVGGLSSAAAQGTSALSAAPTTGASLRGTVAPTVSIGNEPLAASDYAIYGPTPDKSLASSYNILGQPMIPTAPQIGTDAASGATGAIGQGLSGDPNIILPQSLQQYGTSPSQMRIGPGGNLVPTQESGASTITPSGFEQYALPGEETPTATLTATPLPPAGLSKEAQDALQSVYGFGLNTLLSPKTTGLGFVGASTTGTSATTGTTAGTTGGSPGGTELDPSTGKAPQAVWGDKYSSLKEGLNV